MFMKEKHPDLVGEGVTEIVMHSEALSSRRVITWKFRALTIRTHVREILFLLSAAT